jgi:hypothetical protein
MGFYRYEAACKFLERNELLGIIRGHEAQDAGFVFHFLPLSIQLFLILPRHLDIRCIGKRPPRNSLPSSLYFPRQITSTYTTIAVQSSNMRTRISLSGSTIRVHILIGCLISWTLSHGVYHLSVLKVSAFCCVDSHRQGYAD